MKRLLLLLFLFPVIAAAQNSYQIRFQKDSTIIKIYGDSSYIKRSLAGQLTEWIQRNNDYGSGDGIHIEVKSPDGDSTLAGFWASGDGRVYLFSGHQSKLIASRLGTNMYGNYILNPATGGTYPFFILKTSANDSVWLSMATNGLPQWSRSMNLPNTWPASPLTGDFGRSGNILRFQASGGTYGFDYGTAPAVGMGWRWNGTNWAPGYPDTGAVGGGGGSSRWDSLTAPGADLALNMSVYSTTFTHGDQIGDVFTIQDNAGSTADYLVRIATHSSASTRKPIIILGNAGNGVEMLNNGTLLKVGGGHVSADQWLGLDTVRRSSLPVKVALEDEVNSFTQVQSTLINASAVALAGSNNFSGLGFGVQGSHAGSSGAGVYGVATGAATGVLSLSSSGVGVNASSSTGIPLRLTFGGATVADATGTVFAPNVTGAYDLGSYALHFGNAHVDSLIIGTKDSTLTWRGDGKMLKEINRTTTFTSDTAIINITGIDSTYDATWGFIGKPDLLASAGGKCYNGGNVELTSSTSPMNGKYVWYRVWKRN
jgi:hypothetical protein